MSAMQFDRHGTRIWTQARDLLDSEHARRAISQVAIPFGLCAEPSNVKAGGQACPYRFRCVGCEHFRTDVSYLPGLQAYLDDLLRSRERLIAAADIEEWARADALLSQEEIGRIRNLISRIKEAASPTITSPVTRPRFSSMTTTVSRLVRAPLARPDAGDRRR